MPFARGLETPRRLPGQPGRERRRWVEGGCVVVMAEEEELEEEQELW